MKDPRFYNYMRLHQRTVSRFCFTTNVLFRVILHYVFEVILGLKSRIPVSNKYYSLPRSHFSSPNGEFSGLSAEYDKTRPPF